jgi:hypothetical protein
MAILAGRVKMLRETGQISVPPANFAMTTTPTNHQQMVHHSSTGYYSAIFDIDGRTVSMVRYSPIVIILDGDEVVVGGKVKDDGLFHATAFENITRGLRGNNKITAYMPWITGACLAFVAFFWFVALVLLGEESFFFGVAVVMTILAFGCDWWSRDYNRKMTNDANEIADYVKSLAIGPPE